MSDPAPINRNRPTAVTVLAILNFAVGGLLLLGLICGGLSILVGISFFDIDLAPSAGRSIPGYIPYTLVTTNLGLIMAGLLFVAGLGLLRMQLWARRVCIVFGAYSIIRAIVGFWYATTVVNPALERAFKEAQERHDFFTHAYGSSGPAPSRDTGLVGDSIGWMLGLAYGVVLMVVLFLPHVSAAFAGQSLPESSCFMQEDDQPDVPRDQASGDSFAAPDGRRW
jgi:hypothetical protein